MIRPILLVAWLVLLPAAAAGSEDEPPPPPAAGTVAPDSPGDAAATAARQIIALTRGGDTLPQMVERIVAQLAPAFERANPGQGGLIREILEHEFQEIFSTYRDQFVDSLIPVYTQNFTADELEALVAFYQSPLGRKLIAAQPQVSEQAMRMGGMWGQKLGELATTKAISRMQAEGLETDI